MAEPLMKNSAALKFDITKLGDPKNPAVVSIVGCGASGASMMPVLKGLVDEGLYVINYNPRDTPNTDAFRECEKLCTMDAGTMMGELGKIFQADGSMDVSKDFYAPYNWYDLADDFAAVLEQAGVEKASIIGFSTGGTIAQVMMTRHPDKVNCAVLGSSAFQKLPASPAKNEKLQAIMGAMATLTPTSTKEERVAVEMPFKSWMFEAVEGEEDYDLLKKAIEDETDNGWSDQFGGMSPYSTLAWAHWAKTHEEHVAKLKANKVRCLIVSGENDVIVNPEESKMLAANTGNSVHEIHRGGHILGPKACKSQLLVTIADFIKRFSIQK